MASGRRPVFDIWVCQGRLCIAHGADPLEAVLEGALAERSVEDRVRVRLLRGGCFGLCEMSANVVVRRWASPGRRPDPGVDRLTITARPNETVYSKVDAEAVLRLLASHLDDDAPVEALTLRAQEAEVPPDTATARNIRRLRARWSKG